MGACASGAQDAHGFSSAMLCGYMPEVDTLTYQGIFNEHLFYVGEQEKERAVFAQGLPIVHDGNPWLAVFLKSMFDGNPRSAIPIDLSVVIDISGSMSGSMDRNQDRNKNDGNRLQHAIRSVEWLVQEVLRSDDGIAVSTFNQEGHVVQPLTRCGSMDCDAFLLPVRTLRTNGGTRLAAGMKIGRELLGTNFSETRHRRILFLTDMGEMNAVELGNLIEQNAKDQVYVSIVAMGAEFNSSLTETVTQNRGSNYFCATNNDQLRECLVDDFDFNMFPAAFDLDVSVCSGSLEVVGVYGTPFDTKKTVDLLRKWTPSNHTFYNKLSKFAALQLLLHSHSIRRPLPGGLIGHVIDFLDAPVTSITEVNTMFPSRIESNGAMKGGLVLIQMRASGQDQPVAVQTTYTDCFGQSFKQVDTLTMPGGLQSFKDNRYEAALCKGLLLQHYVQVCREHIELAAVERNKFATTEDMLVSRRAALPGLIAELEQFKSNVESRFKADDKMKEVLENFESFVNVFRMPLEEADGETGKAKDG